MAEENRVAGSTHDNEEGYESDEGEPDAWFPCIVPVQEDESSGGAGAPFYPALRWADDDDQPMKQLKVKFLVKSTLPIIPWRKMTYPYDFISTKDILEWANEWSSEEHGLKGIVPKFVLCPEDEEGDIRVRFRSRAASESLIGNDAQNYRDKHTMTINLTEPDKLNSDVADYRRFTIIHQFGHTLGLGHEHQTSRLAGAFKEDKIIEGLTKSGMKLKAAQEKFQKDYTQYTKDSAHGGPEEWSEFDPWSIMCFPIPADSLTQEFKDKTPPDQLERLTSQSYDKRTNLSEIDIKSIKNLYSSGHSGAGQ